MDKKHLQRVILLVLLFLQACTFLKKQNESDIAFFDYLLLNNVSTTSCSKENDKNIRIPYIDCEIYMYRDGMDKGMGCFYAIPKYEYDVWRIMDNQTIRSERYEKARQLLFMQRDTLIKHFDLYVFHVRQEDLMVVGKVDTDDGTEVDDYDSKDDATVYTYKYEEGVWVEKDKNRIGDHSPRSFGEAVMNKILRCRFFR